MASKIATALFQASCVTRNSKDGSFLPLAVFQSFCFKFSLGLPSFFDARS